MLLAIQNTLCLLFASKEPLDEDAQIDVAEASDGEETEIIQPEEGPHDELPHAQLEQVFDTSFGSSSSKSEPTPKRPRARRSFKAPQPKSLQAKGATTFSPSKAQGLSREPLQETAVNRLSRKSLPAGHNKLVVASPAKTGLRSKTRRSIAAPIRVGTGVRPEKENAYISKDDLPFSTLRTEDFDASTQEF